MAWAAHPSNTAGGCPVEPSAPLRRAPHTKLAMLLLPGVGVKEDLDMADLGPASPGRHS
jgi:hypothetical protein